MQDKTIIEFQQGSKNAYRHLFNMLYPVMCLFARKFINDDADAEDLTQEIFIELWHQRAKFESLDQIKAFLYLSIKNKCLNFIKHQSVKEKYSDNAQIDNVPPFEEIVIEAEVIQNLNKAIDNLPDQQKHVILLSLQGLTNDQIAEDMQISVNTVKYHKKTAYQLLREKLGSSFVLTLLF